MFQNLDEAVKAIRSARSLEELQGMINESHVSQNSADEESAPQDLRQKANGFAYLSAGAGMVLFGLGYVFAFLAFWISAVCSLYWLWQVDGTGIIRSLMWVAGSFAFMYFCVSLGEPLASWLSKHRPSGWLGRLI